MSGSLSAILNLITRFLEREFASCIENQLSTLTTLLYHFEPRFHFYAPQKHQKTADVEQMEHRVEMD